MQRPDHPLRLRKPAQRLDDAREAIRIVGVLGAVDGRQHERSSLQAERCPDARPFGRAFAEEPRRVVHHVADLADAPRDPVAGRADPLGREIAHRGLRRAEEPRGEVIGRDAIQLLGHPTVEAPQPRLDMRDRHVELGRREGARQGRVGVSVDEHRIGAGVDEHRLDRSEHRARLRTVRSASDAEMVRRCGNAELLEEHRRHRRVVVLPGVDDDLRRTGGRERSRDRRRLHELRPGA